MNALSRIQIVTSGSVVPIPPALETGGSVKTAFRETMRGAMEQEKGSRKSIERVGVPESPLSRTPSAFAQTPKRTMPDMSGEAGSEVADVDANEEQASTSTSSVPAANEPGSSVPDLLTNGDTQPQAANSIIWAKAQDARLSGSRTSSGLDTPGVSRDLTEKPSREAGKNLHDNSTEVGSCAESTGVATLASAEVPIGSFRVTPPANSFPGGAPTKVTAAIDGDVHNTPDSSKLAPYADIRRNDPIAGESAAATAPESGTTHAEAAESTVCAGAAATPSAAATTVSSTDLLLSSTDGTASYTQTAADTFDSAGSTQNSVALDGSLPGTATGGNVSLKAADLSGATQNGATSLDISPATTADSHTAAAGHPVSTDSLPTVSSGTQVISPTGNMFGAHIGTTVAVTSGPSYVGSLPASMTSSAAFAAMDRADSGGGGFLLNAAPHQIAVGVTDPGLGWIEVRAERAAGQVTAALTSNSTASHAELTAALPAMTGYLNDHNHPAQYIHVEAGWAPGQNSAGPEKQSRDRQHRDNTTSQPLEGIGGIGKDVGAFPQQPINDAVAGVPHRSKVEGHQFSVHA